MHIFDSAIFWSADIVLHQSQQNKLETIKKIIKVLNVEDQDIIKFMKSLDK